MIMTKKTQLFTALILLFLSGMLSAVKIQAVV